MDYVLTTNALTKDYGHFKALRGLSMHVPKGSIYGLVGKNGAGKTTLLRVICGLQSVTNGEYTLYGIKNKDSSISQVRKKMGAVIETPAIYLDMTAKSNLKEQFRIAGISSYKDIPELLKLVGLENTGWKKARHFSLGMRQRLGIAIALTGNPDLLILDEPTNGLDPQGIIEMRELLLKLNRERGITILISSHILDELSRLATHYGFINDGEMLQEISAENLEAACQKHIRFEVSNMPIFVQMLNNLNIQYKVISQDCAEIYSQINLSQLTLALAKLDCEILSVREHDESLEMYFMKLIGGDGNV